MAAAANAASSTSTAVALRLQFQQASIPVQMGEPVDLASLTQGAQAEVTQHPTRADVLGLKNTGQTAWSATLRDGTRQSIDPGRNLRLAAGVRIDFGGGHVAEVVA